MKNFHPKDRKYSNRTKLAKKCLNTAKRPDGNDCNISRCVHLDEKEVPNYITYDAPFMLHYMFPTPIKCIHPDHVAIPLIHLSSFFHR